MRNSTKQETKNIKEISAEYINYLNILNNNKKSAVKNFYLIIKKQQNNKEKKQDNFHFNENIIFDELNDQYLKIKDTLSRCGNIIIEINEKKLIKNILFSFFNTTNNLN